MSDRERWIVYPLIFFAFLLAARDKYVQPEQAEFRVVQCEELHVVSDSGKSLINLYGSLDEAGVMVLYSHGQGGEPGDLPQTDPLSSQPSVGRPVVEIGADGRLGFLRVFGDNDGVDLKLGHERAKEISGLYAIDQDEDLVPYDSQREGMAPTVNGVEPWGVVRNWGDQELGEPAENGTTPAPDEKESSDTANQNAGSSPSETPTD